MYTQTPRKTTKTHTKHTQNTAQHLQPTQQKQPTGPPAQPPCIANKQKTQGPGDRSQCHSIKTEIIGEQNEISRSTKIKKPSHRPRECNILVLDRPQLDWYYYRIINMSYMTPEYLNVKSDCLQTVFQQLLPITCIRYFKYFVKYLILSIPVIILNIWIQLFPYIWGTCTSTVALPFKCMQYYRYVPFYIPIMCPHNNLPGIFFLLTRSLSF